MFFAYVLECAAGDDYRRGSVGSLSVARTAKTLSWIRLSSSFLTKRSSASIPQRKFLYGKRSLFCKSACFQTAEISLFAILRAVDDAKIFFSAAFNGGL